METATQSIRMCFFASRRDHPQYGAIETAMRHLAAIGAEFCFTPQNLGEFWNVTTRPIERNGFGLSSQEANQHVQAIEQTMTLLPDDHRVYGAWRRLLVDCEVRGVQVHDAHIAAALAVHGVSYLLTFNGADFIRFPDLTAIHPADVSEAPSWKPL